MGRIVLGVLVADDAARERAQDGSAGLADAAGAAKQERQRLVWNDGYAGG